MADPLEVQDLADNDQEEATDSVVRRRKPPTSVISMASSLAKLSTHNLRQAVRRSIVGHVPSADSETVVKEEDAWLQAEYNAVVFAFLAALLAITVAVYFVLEPFLNPLLWAVLAGNFLYPFKHSGTDKIRHWLNSLEESRVPLSVGVIISPFSFFNYLSLSVDSLVDSYAWHLLFLSGSIITLYLTYHFSLLLYLYRALEVLTSMFESIHGLLSFAPIFQLVVLVAVQTVVLAISSRMYYPQPLLRFAAVSLWFLILVNLTSWFIGSMGLPLVAILFLLASLIYSPARSRTLKRQTSFTEAFTDKFKSLTTPAKYRKSQNEDEDEADWSEPEVVSDSSYQDEISEKPSLVQFSAILDQSAEPELPDTPIPSSSRGENESEIDLGIPRRPKKRRNQRSGRLKRELSWSQRPSNQLFLLLITCCMIVLLWRYPIFLLLLAPIAMWSTVKKLLARFEITNQVLHYYNSMKDGVFDWMDIHSSSIFPYPLPALYTMYLEADKRVLHLVRELVGSIVSLCMIAGMLIGCVGVTMLLVAQIQLELANTMGLAVQVMNNSVPDTHWLQSVVGGTDNSSNLKETMEHFANKGFHSSREWLANYLQEMIGQEQSGHIIEQVLHTYDNLYHSYILQNSTKKLAKGKATSLWGSLQHSHSITMILRSLWTILSVNLSIAVSILTSISSLLFSGGTMLFNFVIFITTLFYLLIYSNQQYLPLHWISDMTKFGDSGEQTNAFSRIIRSVFHASLRRTLFYGLYTWLVLSVFEQDVIFLPSVLAALAGAVPFIGPYWFSLPAILDLWLLDDRPLTSLLVFILFLIPSFVIEPVINSEIKGGHPYLTGLAIVGGVYYTGLQGTIIGPILLCCFLYVVDFISRSE